ncbi:hypothetical protein [Salinispora fenicalii]|nr:hypothetical protein [Salinispora fenicalii]
MLPSPVVALKPVAGRPAEAYLDYEEAQLLPILDRLSAEQIGDART